MLSKVITISQQKGGSGKTTLAVHLALAFIRYHNLKVAVIDTDPQGSLGKWYMIRTEKKVSNENLTFKRQSLRGHHLLGIELIPYEYDFNLKIS